MRALGVTCGHPLFVVSGSVHGQFQDSCQFIMNVCKEGCGSAGWVALVDLLLLVPKAVPESCASTPHLKNAVRCATVIYGAACWLGQLLLLLLLL